MIVGVGNIEFAVGCADATRFIEEWIRSIAPAGGAAPQRRAGPVLRIDALDLAVVGVDNVELAISRRFAAAADGAAGARIPGIPR